MKYKIVCLFISCIFLVSCNDDSEKRELLRIQSLEKTEAVYKKINDNWNFKDIHVSDQVLQTITEWKEWDIFLRELKQKPKSTIGAFRKKSKDLVDNALQLNQNLPIEFDNAQFKSRIAILTTQLQSLDLYIHLQNIPTDKVIEIIQQINIGLTSMTFQMEQILVRRAIPKEEGENEMIRLLDTSRAIQKMPF